MSSSDVISTIFMIILGAFFIAPYIVPFFSEMHSSKLQKKDSELLSCKNQLTTQAATIRSQRLTIEQQKATIEHYRKFESNLTAIPYAAAIVADFETHGIELLAHSLDWGTDKERLKKVASLREIRKDATALIAQHKEAEYQLSYAIRMFPALEDFLSTEYQDTHSVTFSDLAHDTHDRVKDYLSDEEYRRLSSIERNQLALDRYRDSHRKTNWQIGRDYELYVGYKYSEKGYLIDYYGSYAGLEDLGRDLIAKKNGLTLIIQCKYWSTKKEIHEKHINQLYGTMICYCIEHNLPKETVRGVFVTNISLTDTARKFAKFLEIEVVEGFPMGNYPCIKCNISKNQSGAKTYIYHLPFDQQYDACKIDSPGEFMAMTVAEAEAAGFRRAYRWHKN